MGDSDLESCPACASVFPSRILDPAGMWWCQVRPVSHRPPFCREVFLGWRVCRLSLAVVSLHMLVTVSPRSQVGRLGPLSSACSHLPRRKGSVPSSQSRMRSPCQGPGYVAFCRSHSHSVHLQQLSLVVDNTVAFSLQDISSVPSRS